MPQNTRRRNTLIAILILIIILILLLLLKCSGPKPAPMTTTQPGTPAPQPSSTPSVPPPTTPAVTEKLDPATLTAPATTPAGSTFSVSWTGPNNLGDFVTIVPKGVADNTTGNYRETKLGATLQLTAPITPGPHELRYLTAVTRTIVGRAAIEVTPITATLEAPAEVPLGKPFTVTWTGPDNKGDYITIVDKSAPDAHYGSYVETSKGKTITLTAPNTAGDHEVRYIADPPGRGKTVLARRAIKVLTPSISLSAPDSVIAGSTIEVTWTGPANRGDYITIVEKSAPDNLYGNYTDTAKGSPLELLVPILTGPAELRYNTGDNKVLARRAITITAAPVTLSAPPESGFDTDIEIKWTGPNYPGDYITIVPKETPDGQYGPYTLTTSGSPLSVRLPKAVGGNPGGGGAPGTKLDYEVRYMTGQGNKVLSRTPIKITP